MSMQCYGQSQIKIKNENFAKFINKIPGTKIPVKCKIPGNTSCFRSEHSPAYVVLLEEAKKYLGYSDKDYYVTEYDYDVDEDRKFNIRQVEHAPLVDSKILQKNYIGFLYYRSSSRNIDKCDSLTEVLSTFTLSGIPVDKITIQGHYTKESDWIDFVFLSDDTFKIFHYLPNLENYNIRGGAYYIIDEKKPQTVVEISDYKIDENGKINLIKTHPKQYLKEFVNFYRSYHEDSDDPMNEYDFK
jgi:hypothetical protein